LSLIGTNTKLLFTYILLIDRCRFTSKLKEF